MCPTMWLGTYHKKLKLYGECCDQIFLNMNHLAILMNEIIFLIFYQLNQYYARLILLHLEPFFLIENIQKMNILFLK